MESLCFALYSISKGLKENRGDLPVCHECSNENGWTLCPLVWWQQGAGFDLLKAPVFFVPRHVREAGGLQVQSLPCPPGWQQTKPAMTGKAANIVLLGNHAEGWRWSRETSARMAPTKRWRGNLCLEGTWRQHRQEAWMYWHSIFLGNAASGMCALDCCFTLYAVSTSLDQAHCEICSSVKPSDALFKTKEKQNLFTRYTVLRTLWML